MKASDIKADGKTMYRMSLPGDENRCIVVMRKGRLMEPNGPMTWHVRYADWSSGVTFSVTSPEIVSTWAAWLAEGETALRERLGDAAFGDVQQILSDFGVDQTGLRRSDATPDAVYITTPDLRDLLVTLVSAVRIETRNLYLQKEFR